MVGKRCSQQLTLSCGENKLLLSDVSCPLPPKDLALKTNERVAIRKMQ